MKAVKIAPASEVPNVALRSTSLGEGFSWQKQQTSVTAFSVPVVTTTVATTTTVPCFITVGIASASISSKAAATPEDALSVDKIKGETQCRLCAMENKKKLAMSEISIAKRMMRKTRQ